MSAGAYAMPGSGPVTPVIEDRTLDLEVYRKEIRRLRAENAKIWREKEHFRQMALYQVARVQTIHGYRNRFAKALPDLVDVPRAYEALERLLKELSEADREADDTVERLSYRIPRIWFIRLDDGGER